jgi:hypothetical protein
MGAARPQQGNRKGLPFVINGFVWFDMGWKRCYCSLL